MGLIERAVNAFEGAPVPDFITRSAIDVLVERTRRNAGAGGAAADRQFAAAMASRPLAEHVDLANQQHYEVPAAFFQAVLGPQLKYSSCLYPTGAETLEEAERAALAETCRNADLRDGQSILELGCGWGSLTLHMARTFPAARITAVSNSASQRAFIESRAAGEGLKNVRIITADMNDFAVTEAFDRVVTVEMFEHMANWRALLDRIRGWLAPDGRLFIHIFTHRAASYRFNVEDPADWVARYFFAGGVMPSEGLIKAFDDLFGVEAQWRWSGRHYERTALAWLENFDRAKLDLAPVLQAVYGVDARIWARRWRLFFLATAGLFGCRQGEEWGVSHYRLIPRGRE